MMNQHRWEQDPEPVISYYNINRLLCLLIVSLLCRSE